MGSNPAIPTNIYRNGPVIRRAVSICTRTRVLKLSGQPTDTNSHMDTRTAYALLAVAFVMATLYIMRRRVRQGKRVGKF